MGTPRTAFDAEFGTVQGRCKPLVATQPAGDYVFQLGHERPNVRRIFAADDAIQIEHTFDMTGMRKLRFRARFRPAATLPVGWLWDFTAFLNSHTITSRTIDREIESVDLAVPAEAEIVASGSALVKLAFRLRARGPFGAVDELELPGCWVDAITDDPLAPVVDVFSRSPEPNEVQTPLNTTVRFVAMLLDGSTALLGSDITVLIDGVQAVVAGVAQPGFAVGFVTPLSPLLCGVSATITPAVPFESLKTISVVVQIPSRNVERSWTFTTEDTIAPIVESAFALSPTTIRVVFDEQIGSGATSASNFTIELINGFPAVMPTVIGVELESDTSVLLSLDKIMTRGSTYRVSVVNVGDLFGNVVAAPLNVAEFIGYAWPTMPGRQVSLWERLPLELRMRDETGEHERFIGIMQELFDIYYGIADRALDVCDPDYAPIEWVDLMLADLGNPFGFLDLTEIERRILVQTLLPIFRSKGTGPGIINATRFLIGIDVLIRVYAWAPFPIGEAIIGQTFVLGSSVQSDIYTFEVVVSEFLTDAQRKYLRAIIDYMKVAHEHWRMIEPVLPVVVDHWSMGFSRIGSQTLLHG